MRKVFLFNPTCEMAVVNDTGSYTPPAFLRKFESDLAPLMGFAGSGKDIIVSADQDREFLFFWESLGVELPLSVSPEDLSSLKSDEKLFPFPWGWSRQVHRTFKPLTLLFDPLYLDSPVSKWDTHYRQFYSRETSLRFLEDVKNISRNDDLISVPYTPQVFESIEEIEEWEGRNKPPYVFKTPWSSSGRGLYPVTDISFIERSRMWVKSRLKQQKKLMIEPWLNKKQDVSFQFYIHSDGRISFLGINFFEAGEVGEFKKEFLGIPEELRIKLESFSLPDDWVKETAVMLLNVMKENEFHKNYCGLAGIDGIFFRDEKGGIKLHPCIEINFRMNMGYVNLRLNKLIHPEASGDWQIKQFKQGFWRKFVNEKMAKHPVKMQDGKIISGFLPLTSFNEEVLYGAWAEVNRHQMTGELSNQ